MEFLVHPDSDTVLVLDVAPDGGEAVAKQGVTGFVMRPPPEAVSADMSSSGLDALAIPGDVADYGLMEKQILKLVRFLTGSGTISSGKSQK